MKPKRLPLSPRSARGARFRRHRQWLPVLALAGLLAACSGPTGGAADASASAPAPAPAAVARSSSTAPSATSPSRDPAPPPSAPAARRPLGSATDELVGAGELGLVPSLFGSFSSSVECDFDDAFSTCQ